MSAFNDMDLECEECGHSYRTAVWTAIHAGEDPELKDLLVGGELNIVQCPECARLQFYEHFLLYTDPANELVAYVYPEHTETDRAAAEALAQKGFDEAQNGMEPSERLPYRPVVLFGLTDLADLIRQEELESTEADIAAEICRENNLPRVRIRASEARLRKCPRVLPVAPGDRNNPAAIRAGLDRLLGIHPELPTYADFRARFENSETEKPA